MKLHPENKLLELEILNHDSIFTKTVRLENIIPILYNV